jgi:hypothetical protein
VVYKIDRESSQVFYQRNATLVKLLKPEKNQVENFLAHGPESESLEYNGSTSFVKDNLRIKAT